ncbi:HAMP domain-containing sensor histidine kinase [Cellulomonas sp. KRMCY2]|uniref:HAMP domain-containing sensor histidine kinase n=1 Tax=Cellulomonas sp. KRMCY2 TaxID=1304865 RepID=UPI00045E5EC1|nr:HAMP domain-containing sensor histidine kinase [Cellulomonas sp. KRMCY2]
MSSASADRTDRRRTTLATRVTLACLAVALVAAAVAALSSTRLAGLADRDASQAELAAHADLVASLLTEHPDLTLDELVRGDDEVVRIGPDGRLAGAPRAVLAAGRTAAADVTSGRPVSGQVRLRASTMLVEARPLDGGGFALVREQHPLLLGGVRLARTLLVATAAGAVVAAIAGSGLARLLARPLRHVTSAARELRAGRRDGRVPVEGPREVAELGATVNELAETLQRSEARQREFLLSVSHELRTPLTGVAGFAESIADGVLSEPDEVRAAGRTIVREAGRLEHLVSDLLDLARLGADDFRLDVGDVDLAQLVRDAARVWSARCAATGSHLVVEADGSVPVRTDPVRARQVLDGLAENALRALPQGAPLVLAARTQDGAAVLEVRDGGPGLTESDYAGAFQRGLLNERYRGRRPVGSGIGLALVDGLVGRLGGRITAGPATEGGAAFTVTIPV